MTFQKLFFPNSSGLSKEQIAAYLLSHSKGALDDCFMCTTDCPEVMLLASTLTDDFCQQFVDDGCWADIHGGYDHAEFIVKERPEVLPRTFF